MLQSATARDSTHVPWGRLKPPSLWHVAKCPKVVAGLISKVEMIFGALRALLELGMQPCARHGNFYTPRTPERTYALNQKFTGL